MHTDEDTMEEIGRRLAAMLAEKGILINSPQCELRRRGSDGASATIEATVAVHEPKSCICPTCKRVMRLSRVHALRAFDAIEFYLRCDACDYTSGQLTGISSGEFACDIHPALPYQPMPPDLVAWCEREVGR